MKIKDEYKGKTIICYDSVLGQRRIEVDKIDLKRYSFYTSMGLGYLFEKENVTISYKGIEEDLEADVNEPKEVEPKVTRVKPATKTRKRKPNVATN
jgi:hypothetical protein